MENKRKFALPGLALAAVTAVLAVLPLEKLLELGPWLRELSLSGGRGNAAAWAVVLGLTALPALGLLWRGRCWWDLLLLLDANSKDWYVTYGAGIRSYVEEDDSLGSLFAKHLGEDFFAQEDSGNQAILALFGNLISWYEEHVPPLDAPGNPIFHLSSKNGAASLGGILSGIFFTLAVNFWWIVLLFLVLYGLDSVRFSRYYTRIKQGDASKAYHPFLFWHAPGSQWYEKMFQQAQDGYPELDIQDFINYAAKREEAQRTALDADQAYLDRDKEALAEENDRYNALEAEAAALAQDLGDDPDQRVANRFYESIEDQVTVYEAERLKAGNADTFLRDYLGKSVQ